MNLQELKPICGIYKITCHITERVYIGLAKNIYFRWNQHVNDLVNGRHTNKELSGDFVLYGLSAFEAEVLEECLPEELTNRESYWVYKLDTEGISLYNDRLSNGYFTSVKRPLQ